MDIRIRAIAASVSVIALYGCALTTDRIEIQYAQQPGVAQIARANSVSVNVQVADQRQDKSKVATKKNGYGIEMAPILASEDVAVTVRAAIEKELRARGFQLGAEASLVQITADVTRFYNDFKMGFFAGDAVADLNMSVLVRRKNGDVAYSRQIVVQGIEPNVQLASGDNAKLALDRALANGVKALFEDQAFLSALLASSTPSMGSNQKQ